MISQTIVLLILSALLSITTYAAVKPTGKSSQEQAKPEMIEKDNL